MKISNKDFVLLKYPSAFVYQGVGARYTILLYTVKNIEYLSNTRRTENSAWADAARRIRKG